MEKCQYNETSIRISIFPYVSPNWTKVQEESRSKRQKNKGKTQKPETVKLMIGWQQETTTATRRFQLIFALLTQMNDSASSFTFSQVSPSVSNGRTWRMSDDNELAKRQSANAKRSPRRSWSRSLLQDSKLN